MADNYPNKAKESSLIRDAGDSQPVRSHIQNPRVDQDAPTRKRRRLSTIHEVFAAIFPGGFPEIKDHLVWDIFVPWMQDMLRSGWTGLGDVLFPGSGASTRTQQPPERYSYNEAYRVRGTSYPSYDSQYLDSMRPYPKREDAEEALRDLHDILIRYGFVTLLDYNERVGNPTTSAQQNYGWLNLNSARVEHVRGGWIISMPKAVAIEGVR